MTWPVGSLASFSKIVVYIVFFFFPARKSHITQIAALHGDDKFSTYVMPKVAISLSALEITGLQTKDGVLCY